MKKIALVLAVLLCALPMMAFAEVAVSGSVSFSLGDSETSDTTWPVFAGSSSATGSVSLATDDEKVVATLGFDLMPVIATTYEAYSHDAFYSINEVIITGVADYNLPLLERSVGFFNDHASDETAVGEVSIWNGLVEKYLENTLVVNSYNLVASDDDSDEIVLKSVTSVAADATPDKLFWNDKVKAVVADATSAFDTMLDSQVEDAILNIMSEASWAVHFDDAAYSLAAEDLKTFVQGISYDESKKWSSDDIATVKQALDLEMAYSALGDLPGGDPTVTTTASFVTSATLAFKDIAGLVDMTMNLAGTHVTAGKIKVDGAGHSSTAVSGYPSVMVGLSSGVVEGLNAGVTVYIDDNDLADSASDDEFTWLDESVGYTAQTYGIGAQAGYSMAVMEDLTVGATVAFGAYDLKDEAPAKATSLGVNASGFGGSLNVQWDTNWADLGYVGVMAGYSIMGFGVDVSYETVKATGDVLAYCASPASVSAKFMTDKYDAAPSAEDAPAALLGLGLTADLSELVGMAVTGYWGMDMGLAGGVADATAWNAGVALPGVLGFVEDLTVSADFDADSVEGSTFDWSAGLAYKYSIAAISFSIGEDYSAADDAQYLTWSLGTSVSF